MNLKKILVFTAAMFLTTGCLFDKKDEGVTGLSCTAASLGVCIDYGTGYTDDTAESTCASISGTYAASACATTDSVGRCETSSNGFTLITHYYSTGSIAYTAELAQQACDDGTFTAE